MKPCLSCFYSHLLYGICVKIFIYLFIKKFARTGSIDNLPKSDRPKKMTEMAKDFIETQ